MASTSGSVELSISWNDFQSSMSSSFGNLRKEKELFDVTLVSDDEVQISAHKVVLAACSTFFKNTLKSGIHSHPLIFLSGISSLNINSLLEYIYEGKVAIHQEQLESFLETATKLKITSLLPSSASGEKTVHNTENQEANLKENSTADLNNEVDVIQEEKEAGTLFDKLGMKHEEGDYIDRVTESTTNRMLKLTKIEHESTIKTKDEGAIMESQVSKSNPYLVISHNVNEINEKCQEMLYRDKGLLHCRECGKTGSAKGSNMRKHVEIHMEGLSYKCSKCDKTYRTKNAFFVHFTNKHRN